MYKILIIGSNGYIGRPLTNILRKKYKLVLPSHRSSQIDVLKKNSLAKYIKKDIDIIINLSGQVTEKKIFKNIILDGNKNIIDRGIPKNRLIAVIKTKAKIALKIILFKSGRLANLQRPL